MGSDVTIIIEDGGALGGGGNAPPTPTPAIGVYTDEPGTITTTGALVDAWQLFTQSGGARPTLIVDSVDSGLQAVRFDAGKTMALPAGVADFASRGEVTFVLVWRQLVYADGAGTENNDQFDTTNGGTNAGVQIYFHNKFATSSGRHITARVFDGSTWIVEETLQLPCQSHQALIWTVSVIVITATSLTIYADGYPWLEVTFSAITFPTADASPGVLGGSPFDTLAFEVWAEAFSAEEALAAATRLRTKFSLPNNIVLLWNDDKAGEPDSSACEMSDGTFVALAIKNPGPSDEFVDGVIQARTSPDGLVWTPDPGPTGDTDGMQLPFTPPPNMGMVDPVVSQFSNGRVLAVANHGDANVIRTLRAANPAAVRSNTWTNETVVTTGTPFIDCCASNPTEDPANLGTVYLCAYGGLLSTDKWDGYFYKSTDFGATFGAKVVVADGTADGVKYAEMGLLFVTAAAAAKYPDLTEGQLLFLVRSDADNSMFEYTAATDAGPFAKRATNIIGVSAARFRFLVDGTMVFQHRNGIMFFNTLIRRTGVNAGVAEYIQNPQAPAIVSTNELQNNGQYGNVLEPSPGLLLSITSTRLGLFRSQTYARFWPEKQLYGQMPISVSPSTVSGKNSGDTVQFTARGAGGAGWSLSTNGSGGSIGASTGLYTAGVSTGVDVIRFTDRNGYFDASKDVSVSVTGIVFQPWTLPSCLLWVEPSSIVASAGNLTSWHDKTSNANHLIPGDGTPVPASTTVNTGSGAWLKSTNNVTLGRFTTIAKLATSGVSYLAFHDTGGAGGNYWYTQSPSAFIARSDGNQNLYSANFSVGVRAGSQLVAGLSFVGVAADAQLTLGGVAQTLTTATGDLGTNTDTGLLYVGGNVDGSDTLTAAYKAFGVFDDTISPSDLASVYSYMATL